MSIQIKKGVLELCVLSILSRRACYGYELVQEISKQVNISEGTIYPLMRRLTKEGYFSTYLRESPEGPPRKYYELTERGREAHVALRADWYDFVVGVNQIVEGEVDHEQADLS